MFHLEKLKDLTWAHEFAVTVSNRFEVLGTFEDQVELWDTFKHETLEAAKECVGGRLRGVKAAGICNISALLLKA